jgi:glycosyltransferase involved in cell wall biosynthesis
MYDSDSAKITTLGQNQAKNTIAQQSGPWRLTTLTNQSIYFGLKSHTEFGTLGLVTAVVQIGAWVRIEQDRHDFDTNDSTLIWGKPTYSTFDVLPKSMVQPWTPILQWPTFTLSSQPRRRLRLTHVTQFNAIDGQSHVLLRTAMGMPAEEFDILFVSSEPFAPNSTSVSNLLRHNIGVVHAPVVVDEHLVHQYFNDNNNYEQAIDTLVQELEHAITALLDSSSALGKPQQSCENLPPSLWKLIGPLTHSLAGSDIVTFTNIASLTAQDAIIGLAAKCAGVPVVVCDPGNLNHALPTLKGVTALVVPSHVAAAHWQRMFDRHRVVNIPIKVAQPGASVAVLQSSNTKESNTFVIAFIGRLAQTKNPSVFVRVAKEILNKGYQGKKIQFWIIGDGALKNILKQMTIELGLDTDIVFKGSVPHKQVLEHLSNKDIHLVLHTTLTNETFCLSNVEAMAAGVPVITYGVGGVADYLRKPKKDGGTLTTFALAHGFVVHPPTVKAMANVVIDVLKKGPVYFEKIKQNGLRYVKTHGLLEQHMVERFSHIYKSLVFKEGEDSAPALSTKVRTAVAAGTTLSMAAAELHHQLIELNPKDAFRSAVPLYDRATRLFRGVPLNEWWSGGTSTDHHQTMAERNHVAMRMLQHRRKTALPEIIRLGQQKWLELQRTQDPDGIATNTPHGNNLWPGNFDSRGNFYLTTLHKLMHDAEQLRYNVEKGIMPTIFLQVADNYTQVHRLLATKSGVKNVNAYVFLNTFALEMIGTTYNWMNHRSHVPKISTSFATETLSTVVRSDGSVGERNQVNAQLGTALHASTNFEKAEQEYYSNARAPGLTVIDNFLSPQALKNMLHFLQASTIWFDVKNGYLGAYFNAGLSTPLLSQIEDELRMKMPRVIGNLSLNTVWAYKCTNASPEGLAIHADMAAVNINLWLTPTESNLNGGGLIVYLTRDEELPKNWNFTSMNYFDEFSIKKMKKFVRDTNSQEFEVEYRQNRATVFHSRLFHESSTFKLKRGYKNSRINLTFLFGSPNLDKKLTTW